MLKQLTLQNFVLVDALDIDFQPGLTTITGESGAGKSILLNALGLLLGERARTEVIRPGAEKADVCAEFDLSNLNAICAQLEADELTGEDPQHCLVRRVVSANGRSRAFINGVPVTSQYLRTLGEGLVDIHGQNEHQRLADRHTQRMLLDDYAGTNKLAAQVAGLYRDWQKGLVAINALEESLTAAADRRSLLTYQLEELDEFALGENEFTHLEQDHKRLNQANDTLTKLQESLECLDKLDALRASARHIEAIDDSHPSLKAAQESLGAALNMLDDAQHDLRHYEDQVVVDPEALGQIEQRLNTAQDLARKHRVNPEALAAHVETLRDELSSIDANQGNLAELREKADGDHAAFVKQAKALSTKRRKAAPRFAKAVSGYMRQLGITSGSFEVSFSDTESEHGLDRVEFFVTTNPNFPAGPLTQIASGGEQTRIALSIQIVAAQNSALPCLILDEADVGVGGTTADTVGRILRDLGEHTQVLCVTHAPQVAALGNNHYRVVKQGDNTDIHQLQDDLRIDELARMLAGADITDKTRDYAQSLLEEAS